MLGVLRKTFGLEKQGGVHDFLPKPTDHQTNTATMRAREFKGSADCASALIQITGDLKLAKSASLIITCEDDLIRSRCVLKKTHHYKDGSVCILTRDHSGNEMWFATTQALRDHYLSQNKDVLLMKEFIVSFSVPVS